MSERLRRSCVLQRKEMIGRVHVARQACGCACHLAPCRAMFAAPARPGVNTARDTKHSHSLTKHRPQWAFCAWQRNYGETMEACRAPPLSLRRPPSPLSCSAFHRPVCQKHFLRYCLKPSYSFQSVCSNTISTVSSVISMAQFNQCSLYRCASMYLKLISEATRSKTSH